MLNVLKTLWNGAGARAEEAVTDAFAIDLVEQKIREAENSLGAAKKTLASLIIRRRNEEHHLGRLDAQIRDLESRTGLALDAGHEELARDAAATIADLTNERVVRAATIVQLAQRVVRTEASVVRAHRRIIDLKQGLISARAVDAERRAQKSLNRSLGGTSAVREAEALIQRVMNFDDPLEQGQVLDDIDASLDGSGIRDRLSEAGFGDRSRTTADDVLARLRGDRPSAKSE